MSRLGCPVTVFAQAAAGTDGAADHRTAALFAGSIAFLRNLGVWHDCARRSAPIAGIRIIDDTGGLLKAPEVLFTASEQGRNSFGYNVPNGVLTAVLAEAVSSSAEVRMCETAGVTSIRIAGDRIDLGLAEGGVHSVALVAGADGRASPSRSAAGIAAKSWTYPQAALVCNFAHGRSHGGISTEFHRPAGPLTVVPMPGSSSSLVWVDRPDEAARLKALAPHGFRAELERRLQGLLGTIGEFGPRGLFPLTGLSVETTARSRIALVGESCHVFPPIGAQGLNLGLRDVAELADCIADAVGAERDIGGTETLESYARARASDISTRTLGVDILNRTLIADILPTHLARGAGLHLLAAIGPLRRRLVREGLEPSLSSPSLMRQGGAELLARRMGSARSAEPAQA